jgi:SAM-dependent methyltransferase
MQYPDRLNPDLLDRIPLDAQLVLDVGCGSGALGAEYKRRNPAACVLGIEQDESAARIAASRLDRVFVVDLDADSGFPIDEIQNNSVDCLIYGDVLEHLHNPWTILEKHSAWLSPKGIVLICVPNVEHWSFTERILRGTWDYEDQGLFDSTHVRWFSSEMVRRVLRQTGLVPIDVIPRIFDAAASENFVEAMAPALHSLGIDRQAYSRRAAPIQHVWRATRQMAGPPLHLVSTMLNPVGGVSHVRVMEPMQAMTADATLVPSVIGVLDTAPDTCGEPRIFIFHRPLLAGDHGLTRVRALLEQGWLVVCEFDDHPDYIPVLQRPDIQNFRAVHAIQTSTEPLAHVLRRQNPEVMVFPNAVVRLPDTRNHVSPDYITLFFAGLNRENEWPPYLQALNGVAARAGSRLHFQIVNDRGLFEALQTPHKSYTPLCDYETYQNLLGFSEISFMPLLDTPFNRCKSDLKFIEAAAHRVVALASPIVYGDSIQDGQTGVLFRDANELEQRLSRLVANPDVTRGIGDGARAFVEDNRMLAYQVAHRSRWYHSLWARREELNHALLARIPELARGWV